MNRTMKDTLQQSEWKLWQKMCNEIQSILKISREEFNARDDMRKLMEKIANWGYANHELMKHITERNEYDDMKPLFATITIEEIYNGVE